MGEKWPIQFCLQHATSTVSVGTFYMPQIYDMGQAALLPFRRNAEVFFARKIRRLQPGLNPRTWVPEASMLTTRPLKPLRTHCTRGRMQKISSTPGFDPRTVQPTTQHHIPEDLTT